MNETQTDDHEVTVMEPENVPAVPAPITPMDMLQLAIDRGADLDQLERLMDLQQRFEADQARKAYVTAMAEFKSTPLVINKNKSAGFDHKTGGGKTEYDYATLDNVTSTICPALSKHGLSHAWSINQGDGGIAITCTLTHKMGHSESVTMTAPADMSGTKNTIQGIASTNSYLSRYTLLAITGLATADKLDDDAASVEVMISEEQKAEIVKLMQEANASSPAFLKHFGIDYLEMLPEAKYENAVKALKAKRKQNK